ncbi:MAG: DUF222 domain-containing protein [Actinomycetota bacterium]
MCSDRAVEIEAAIAVVCGQINALHGRLVELLAEAAEAGLSVGEGLHSPGAYAAWQTGGTAGHGRALAAVADRSDELPETVRALAAGEISLHQAAAIARHAPAWADGEARSMAESMTPAQLTRVCSRYPSPDDHDEPDAAAADTRRQVSSHHDTDGTWHLRATLAAHEGELVATALRSHHDALLNERPDGEPLPSAADALVRMAEHSLGAGAGTRPHHARTKVLVHVDAEAPAGPHARFHLGPALSRTARRELTCDATFQLVVERHGRPIGVGRSRTIPAGLRTAVEDRDHGCRVPGCGRRHVQLHHLQHWEDGGVTETHNLVALCPQHHRAHHRGRLEIDGTDADAPGGVTFRQHGRTLCERPPPATNAGLPPPEAPAYLHPTGERLDPRWIGLGEPPRPTAA